MKEKTPEQKLNNKLKNIIIAGTVSVFTDPDGEMKEYTVLTHDGKLLDCVCMSTVNETNMPAYEYTIELNETPIYTALIPNKRTIYTPQEQTVLELFKMCSDKLIYQETQIKLQNLMGGMKQKKYMA